MRTLTIGFALLFATLSTAAPAAACCHIYELDYEVGACTAHWEGSVFDGYSERASVTCAAGGDSVTIESEHTLLPCEVSGNHPNC